MKKSTTISPSSDDRPSHPDGKGPEVKENHAMNTKRAFTLLEMLVVTAIIAVLITILVPALGYAGKVSQRAQCLARQRQVVRACQTYSDSNEGIWPSVFDRLAAWPATITKYALAPEMRDEGATGLALGIGLLVPTQHLPTTQLPKVVHCPVMDTTGAGVGGRFAFYGMDKQTQATSIVGASFWETYPTRRIATSYSYRQLSYAKADPSYANGTPYAVLRSNGPTASANFVVYADNPDPIYGRISTHKDGYNRVFGDGHGGYFSDPTGEIDKITALKTSGTDYIDGFTHPKVDEEIYQFMSRQN